MAIRDKKKFNRVGQERGVKRPTLNLFFLQQNYTESTTVSSLQQKQVFQKALSALFTSDIHSFVQPAITTAYRLPGRVHKHVTSTMKKPNPVIYI